MPLVLARRDRLIYKRTARVQHFCHGERCEVSSIIMPGDRYFAVVALTITRRWYTTKTYHTECLPPTLSDWMQRTTLKGEDLLARKVTQTLP